MPRSLALVFPTHVGVFLLPSWSTTCRRRLPHARGGVSLKYRFHSNHGVSSPRTWGCFLFLHLSRGWFRVFPTHVGVFPQCSILHRAQGSLPHARGGVSDAYSDFCHRRKSSPRTWGCFYRFALTISTIHVFPTHVGVFPNPYSTQARWPCLPHARGGVSIGDVCDFNAAKSSPRTWGCFSLNLSSSALIWVFPTHVGVFPDNRIENLRVVGLPHARGGVSCEVIPFHIPGKSSPRTWGCFYAPRNGREKVKVFPTHVGVFPRRPRHPPRCGCLPHARGGVSTPSSLTQRLRRSSPRTWGCFSLVRFF
ncbi:hypothetical protein SM64_02115 [Klebsiella pneumoniae]|nr:hypothetical protein SM64_02115 [Klebsiella pneumoniae]